ncbi:COMM domain-containing protein 7 isoform X2 [Meles meles]|uniref:COMM domain-containing protein 7 isoform X2 n=1 Tax=Meles meles TaxID=9662 RepID=UPI001E69B56D|nr:COMM domain-containing protein 7 isoform X2 [Meles meles]
MGRLHCTQDPVPEAVGGDMQQLNQLGAQFSALTEVLFHFLTEPKEVERFLAQLSEFATTNQISLGPLRSIVKSLLLIPNVISSSCGIVAVTSPCLFFHPWFLPGLEYPPAAHLGSCCTSQLLTLHGALKKSLTADQVRADLITLGLSEEKATYFSEKWKQSAPTLARWAIGQTLMINQLIDMEWKFGVTSGSSELEKVGSIFLQLKLVVKKGNQTENLYIELTLPQFYSFLHEMERVRSSMECLS